MNDLNSNILRNISILTFNFKNSMPTAKKNTWMCCLCTRKILVTCAEIIFDHAVTFSNCNLWFDRLVDIYFFIEPFKNYNQQYYLSILCVVVFEKLHFLIYNANCWLSRALRRGKYFFVVRKKIFLKTKFAIWTNSYSSNLMDNERPVDFQFALYPVMMSYVLSTKWRKKKKLVTFE